MQASRELGAEPYYSGQVICFAAGKRKTRGGLNGGNRKLSGAASDSTRGGCSLAPELRAALVFGRRRRFSADSSPTDGVQA